jgi:hypothetical protein
MTAIERVRKHRDKLREEHCRRLEVWIGGSIIDGIRQLADTKGQSTWEVVQDALKAYMTGHATTAVGNQSTPPSR